MIRYWTLILAYLLLVACEAEQDTKGNELPSQQPEVVAPKPTKELSAKPYENLALLLFKKENKLELWATTEANKKEKVLEEKVDITPELPIGIFKAKEFSDKGLTLHYPNAFYKRLKKKTILLFNEAIFISDTFEGNVIVSTEFLNTFKTKLKTAKQHQIIIFPNDARKNDQLKTCIRCPKSMVEVYAQLELYVKDY